MAKKKMKTLTFDRVKRQSPRGKAAYAYLTKPDDKFGDPVFKITLRMDPKDPEVKKMIDVATQFQREYFESIGKKAPKGAPRFFKKNDETGEIEVCFKTKARADEYGRFEPINVYNSQKKRINIPVWRDDVVRVSYTLAGYDTAMGTGTKVFLNAVQLLVSNYQNGGDGSDVFDTEDEFEPVVDGTSTAQAEYDGAAGSTEADVADYEGLDDEDDDDGFVDDDDDEDLI